MQMVCNGNYPGKSSVMFLPMIDLNPSDMTCIYSTLSFISDQAGRYRVTPIITFDQPLWWKALMITLNEPRDSKIRSIVLRLGGLHTEMSFLGCIGHLMAESGLEDILQLVYAENAVRHMLSGKALSRAIRGHFIVDAAVNALLVSDTFDIPLPHSEAVDSTDSQEAPQSKVQSIDDDLKLAGELYKQLQDDVSIAKRVCTSDVLQKISKKLAKKRTSMQNQRTAVLWMQYMDMVDILRKFIKAERTGQWDLHLQAVNDMLPYFAAAGHSLYAKSAYVYLQLMEDLKQSHPDVYKSFQDGLHVVRRSDRYWAGLSTDLIIEQVLMRSVKTSGGLTRGRGMTEMQRLVWLLSMPACADLNNAMQNLTGIRYLTSEQHKDSTTARKERDHKDTTEIIAYLQARNPFSDDPSLRNIATGIVADKDVNVDESREVGRKILSSMVGCSVHDYSFKKKEQAVTLASKTSVRLADGNVQVDPQLLFQRLSVVATGGRFENPQSLFKYEMCSYPPALFDSSLLPRQANKPALADAIWANTKDGQTAEPTGNAHFVVDGGALLHRVPWPRGLTFEAICSLYVQYVTRKYGKATVVFDGYEDGPSTKDCTHLRRTGTLGPTVNFDSDMVVKSKKAEFLANKANKQRFINLLGGKLEASGCTAVHASGDADLEIVQTAIQSARNATTVLIGDDTDLLVLLCYHAVTDGHDLFFMPEPKQTSKTRKLWNIKKTKSSLGPNVYKNILFVHAVLGCDTTSRLYGIGKGVAFKKISTDVKFRDQAKIFDRPDTTKQEIIQAGEKALLCLYGGSDESLDVLRYTSFCKKVATGSSFLQPEQLPPTSAAAAFHSLRVFFQVQQWKGDVQLRPENWGWSLKDGKLLPIRTDLAPAHSSLLEVIRCNCKSECNTLRCTCKKHDLDCSPACGVCKGHSCKNSPALELDDDYENS